MITITILLRSNKPSHSFPLNLEIDENKKLVDIKLGIHQSVKNLTVERQRLSDVNKKPLLDDNLTLNESGIKNGDVLYVKDLGPQISWRTVFVVEYIGPLIIHPVFYFLSNQIYRRQFDMSMVQTLAFTLIMLHFIKREIETLFVHRFSNATMPFKNVFKNSAHYHLLSGLLTAVAIYGPWYSPDSLKDSHRGQISHLLIWTSLWVFFQISNLVTHIKLRNLRPAGTTKRAIPYGYGFNWVSCPNYFFEIGAWVSIFGLTGSWAIALFTIVGTVTMANWAAKKHVNYKKEFGDKYPKDRRILIPFIW